jgi:Ala-tRNA(Pro) deacylase
MATNRAGLLRRLDQLGIAHTTFEHPPVYTVEEAERHTGHIPGGHCKNLFLKDRKGGLWLLICLNQRRIDINRLAKVLGCARLSFGRAELLQEVLGVAPGGVTPFALINDRERRDANLRGAQLPSADQCRDHDDRGGRSAQVHRGVRPRAQNSRPRRHRDRNEMNGGAPGW